MSQEIMLANLDDQEILGILSEMTIELREGLSDDEKKAIQSEEEARLAIASVLQTVGENEEQIVPEAIISEDPDVETTARGVLEILLNDPIISSEVEELIKNPPEDLQLGGVKSVVATAVILAVLVTWLQTRIEIEVNRKDGQTEYSIGLIKEPTENSTIREIVKFLQTGV